MKGVLLSGIRMYRQYISPWKAPSCRFQPTCSLYAYEAIQKYGALKSSTFSFTVGLVMYIPIFLYDVKNFTTNNLTLPGILGFAHLALIVAFAGYFLFTYAIKKISVTQLTTSTHISPVVTIVFSWLLLKEQITYFFIICNTIN